MHREIKMAEDGNSKRRTEGDDQASKSAKATRLLREVTTLLSEEEAKETLGAEQTTQQRGASNANAILNDFRSIFAPYQATQAVHRAPHVNLSVEKQVFPPKTKAWCILPTEGYMDPRIFLFITENSGPGSFKGWQIRTTSRQTRT